MTTASPTVPPSRLQPAAAATLQRWHHMIATRDLAELPALVAAHAVFKSPMAHAPYESAEAVVLVLRTVLSVFEDFAYHRQLATDDGLSAVLEFSANVGDRQLRGVDLIRFDEAGQIVEFEVMVRPLSGLQALGTEMAKRLGQVLPAFKGSRPTC
ncbi:MAG TPA: nuclear transport factor 2 family protein [Kofleriaceae bacterium]